jgi:hypothetical protein
MSETQPCGQSISTILSISKILILELALILIQQDLLREIVLLQINALLHEVVLLLLSNRFVIHDISMQAIDQIKNVD